MTTHQTPPLNTVTRETWRTMVEVSNDSAATDDVDWTQAISPHYNPRGRHRWLWHYAIPMGELAPGEQAITSRSGTAYSKAAAERQVSRLISMHYDEVAGRDPHGPTLDRIRSVGLAGLVVAGFALFVMTAGCTPSMLGTVALVAGVVGMGATVLKSRRADRARARRL